MAAAALVREGDGDAAAEQVDQQGGGELDTLAHQHQLVDLVERHGLEGGIIFGDQDLLGALAHRGPLLLDVERCHLGCLLGRGGLTGIDGIPRGCCGPPLLMRDLAHGRQIGSVVGGDYLKYPTVILPLSRRF